MKQGPLKQLNQLGRNIELDDGGVIRLQVSNSGQIHLPSFTVLSQTEFQHFLVAGRLLLEDIAAHERQVNGTA